MAAGLHCRANRIGPGDTLRHVTDNVVAGADYGDDFLNRESSVFKRLSHLLKCECACVNDKYNLIEVLNLGETRKRNAYQFNIVNTYNPTFLLNTNLYFSYLCEDIFEQISELSGLGQISPQQQQCLDEIPQLVASTTHSCNPTEPTSSCPCVEFICQQRADAVAHGGAARVQQVSGDDAAEIAQVHQHLSI